MIRTRKKSPRAVPKSWKARTGIAGLDEIMHGGLPRGRATLLVGGPGSGKTVMALETLVHGALEYREPGLFVSFEEDPKRIIANSSSFGWGLPARPPRGIHFVDGRPPVDLIRAGEFDLLGMLAALEAKCRAFRARRIVFDSLDMVLALLPDSLSARREVLRVNNWLLERELTALITAKDANATGELSGSPGGGFLQYMADCVLELGQRVDLGISHRHVRVVKYRGSSVAENETPFVIGVAGLEVAGVPSASAPEPTHARVTTGIPRLDTMLTGGYHRGSGILITGAPGTAKSTLAGAFAEAACLRGEPTLFVSFDSAPLEVERNLASVGIRLARFRRSGLLHILAARHNAVSGEIHFMRIRTYARRHKVRCIVVDPISALGTPDRDTQALGVVVRLTDWAKAEGITLLCTSQTEGSVADYESTQLQISTIADTWIHLTYRLLAGERNRGLTIVKSRGTSHSNQVRELVLSNKGVELADVFTAGGEVLMGTLRWEREAAIRAAESRRTADATHRVAELERAETDLNARLLVLDQELVATRHERLLAERGDAERKAAVARRRSATGKRRRADHVPANGRESP